MSTGTHGGLTRWVRGIGGVYRPAPFGVVRPPRGFDGRRLDLLSGMGRG